MIKSWLQIKDKNGGNNKANNAKCKRELGKIYAYAKVIRWFNQVGKEYHSENDPDQWNDRESSQPVVE